MPVKAKSRSTASTPATAAPNNAAPHHEPAVAEGATLLPASETIAPREVPAPAPREVEREAAREADAVFAKLKSMKGRDEDEDAE